ncbi:hypothetical protein B7P43_G16996 [Cryptotermes secundus]|uniref:Coiled-coil domain-containing protein 9 n=1 Tax=Cryptotermes secundus TaxID=105785 RepID=A0A2J7QYA4_9NEOP|nr:uncharacterized protein LOC111864550 isoform X2 [Cryptotermes secundus]PNF33565.1 hypothetical protein B7P43_G16996 [Cryptotermes secundus]
MARSKQEALLLEERIEKIRKKNEEIKRRHLEVEADKQNAAKLNALVQVTSPTVDWPIGGRSPPHSHGTSRAVHSEQRGPQQNTGSKSGSAECCTSGERDGPPRDSTSKFLVDKEQEYDRRHSQQQPQRRGRSGGWNRGAFTRDRGKRSSPQQGRGRDVHLPEYEAWRAERNRIDSDRISRQRTSEGHWRREWDNEKITQEEEDVRGTAKMSRSGGFHRSNTVSHPYDDHKVQIIQDRVRPGENSSSRLSRVSERGGRGHGMSQENRGNLRGKRYIRAQTSPIQDIREENAVAAHSERTVISTGESIKISVANSSPAPPVRSVRVNAPLVAGTGRVGPRQNLCISYSSQSEDEVPPRRVELRPCRTPSSHSKAPPDAGISNRAGAAALSKPPLPPAEMKQDPKPKRERPKRVEHGTKLRKQREKEEINTTEVSKRVDKKEEEEEETVTAVENCQREIELGGDDSWEDVTTSGNDSACEELSPHSNIDSTVDAKSAELNSGMLLNTEVEPEMVRNTQVKSEMTQNTEVNSELLQNTEMNSEMVQKTEVKSEMFQSTEEEPVMIQKSQLLQNMEAKCSILQNTEVKTGNLQNTEVKSGMDQDIETNRSMIQDTEVKSGIEANPDVIQNTEEKPRNLHNTEVKSGMDQDIGANPGMIQNIEVKSGNLHNTEVKSGMGQDIGANPGMIQNIEVKSGNLHNTEVKSGMGQDIGANPGMIQNIEVKSGNLHNTEVKSGTLRHKEEKMGMLQADGSHLNSESDNCIGVSKVTTNSKVRGTIMQEVAQETLMSERSTDFSEIKDVSEIYLDKTHSDILVKTKEGTMNETTELKEKESVQLVTHTEKGLEGEIETGSWNGCEHNEGQGKVDVIKTTGSGSLSDSVAAAIVPEEKQESNI